MELQILLMEQQQSMEQISQQIVRHDKKISELYSILEIVKRQLNQLLEAAQISTLNEKPPHY